MESYRHVEHACFVYFDKSQKMKALGQKMLILLLFHVARSFFNHTSFVHFQISSKLKAVEAKERNEKS